MTTASVATPTAAPPADTPWASLRQLLTLLDWMDLQLLQTPGSASTQAHRLQETAQSLLDASRTLLRLHRTGTRPDGRLYCAFCLGETGTETWPCQTVRCFGIAVLRHWGPAAMAAAPAGAEIADSEQTHAYSAVDAL